MKSAHKSSVATVKPADGANTLPPSLKPRDMDHCSAAPRRYTAPHARAGVGADPGESRGIVASLGFGLFHLSRGGADDSRKLARALTIRIAVSLVLFALLMLAWYLGLIAPTACSPASVRRIRESGRAATASRQR